METVLEELIGLIRREINYLHEYEGLSHEAAVDLVRLVDTLESYSDSLVTEYAADHAMSDIEDRDFDGESFTDLPAFLEEFEDYGSVTYVTRQVTPWFALNLED